MIANIYWCVCDVYFFARHVHVGAVLVCPYILVHAAHTSTISIIVHTHHGVCTQTYRTGWSIALMMVHAARNAHGVFTM